eukprot:12417229-Karenia_brevis.AAC.1
MAQGVICDKSKMSTIYLIHRQGVEPKKGRGVIKVGEEGGEDFGYMVPQLVTLPHVLETVFSTLAENARTCSSLDSTTSNPSSQARLD